MSACCFVRIGVIACREWLTATRISTRRPRRLARLDAGFAYHVTWRGGSAQLVLGQHRRSSSLPRAAPPRFRRCAAGGPAHPHRAVAPSTTCCGSKICFSRGAPVRGVDFGTGAHHLPAAKIAALRWTWIATELDPASVDAPQRLPQRLGAEDWAREVEAPSDGAVEAPVSLACSGDEACDFVLCNPRFRRGKGGRRPRRRRRSRAAASREQRRAGGEVGFKPP